MALAIEDDQHHSRALDLADELERTRSRLITTHAVMFEIGNALSKQRYRAGAVKLLRSLQADPQVEIQVVGAELYAQAVTLYSHHHDKEWGLTDCLSFAVMRERGIVEALTADKHFEQAGFRALMK